MRSRLVAVCLAACSCGIAEGPDVGDPDAGVGHPPLRELREVAIFTGTETLRVDSPRRCEAAATADLSFQWSRPGDRPGTGEERVVAMIFRNPPLAGASIRNPEDAVWWWSSGWSRQSGSGSDGNVRFSQGRSTGPGGALDASLPPDAERLAPGRWHWFAAWAWDANRKLSYATEARAFCVGAGCPCEETTAGGVDTVEKTWCLTIPGPPPKPPAGCND